MLNLRALRQTTIFLLIMAALLYPALIYAETTGDTVGSALNKSTENRPKTALVLSGGGARGAAHVGVLKVLEELNIPIDYVVGTSMGSIVGGLYAAGYSPAELEHLFKTIDWETALKDTPPREMLSYKRKQADKDLLGVEVGFRRGAFTIPGGLIAGQELGVILKNAVQRAGTITLFDDLPIPFRAVATDLGNGRLVSLDSGDLATAMRASMSVPSVFVPVTINGRKLIDGGLVSNLPVQIARDMGADRIIAVDISSGFIDEDKLGSVLGVSLQMINVLMQQNINNSIAALKPGDLYLRPDLGDFSSINFKEAYTIIDNGYQAASAKRISLGNFSVPTQSYLAWQQKQRHAEPKKPPTIHFIEVKGNQRVDKQQILARIKQPIDEKLDSATLENDLGRIYSIGDFESVDYNLVQRTGEGTGLKIEVLEKPWGPHYLRTAIQLSDDFEGGSNYNLRLNHRWTQLNHLGGEWENALQIGKDRSFITQFHQPLTHDGRFFISTQLEISGDNRDIYSDNERIGEYLVSQRRVKLDVGWTPHSDSEVRLGLEYGKVDGELRIGDSVSLLGNFKTDIGAINISAGLDRQDNPYFPTEGIRAEAHLKIAMDELGSNYDYNLVSFNASKFWSRSGGGVIGAYAAFASGFNDQLPTHEQFSLGGLGRLSGLNKGQLRGSHLGLASAVYYQPLEGLPGNFGFSLEAGNVWQNKNDISFNDLVYSTSLFWSYDSPLGAFYLGYGLTDYGEKAVHLTLGQPF